MNPARPAPGAVLCRLDEIADPGAKTLCFGEGAAVFIGFVVRKDGRIRGYVDRCPHARRPLAAVDDRYLTRDGELILCSAHGALFRIEDGVCIAGPCAGQRLVPWPVAVDGEIVRAA